LSYDLPSQMGEKHPLTKQYPATDSYITDSHGNRQPMVFGAIVKSADLDLVASKHFGEEILCWRLCLESRCTMSTVPGTTIEPIKSVNIMEFERRFPDAFTEYRGKYGEEGLPERYFGGTSGIHPSLIGEYVERKPKGSSIAEKKAALLNELKRLEAAEIHQANMPVSVPADDPDAQAGEYNVDGTPLADLRGIPTKPREVLEQNGVVTIEGLANLSDYIIDQLGPADWAGYRKKAQAWMKRNERHPGVEYEAA